MNLFCYLWFRIFNNVKIYIFSRLFYAFRAVSVKILGERERVRERESLCVCMNWQADSFMWMLSCFWRKIFECYSTWLQDLLPINPQELRQCETGSRRDKEITRFMIWVHLKIS